MIESAYLGALQVHRTATLAIASWSTSVSPRVARAARPRADGDIDATSLRTGRRFNLTGYAKGDTPLAAQQALDGLAAALEPLGPQTLVWRREGDTADLQAAVVLDSDIGAPLAGSRKVIRYELALFAPDPRMYGTVLNSAQRTGAGDIAVTHGGTISTPPTIQVEGASNSGTLTITNTTTGGAIVLTGLPALSAGELLDIDTVAATVYFDGAFHPEVVVAASTDWWRLAPGASTIAVSGTALAAGTITRVRWRDARI